MGRKSSHGPGNLSEELVAATPSQRNWKGIAIALLVIASVIGLVALAVVIITPPDPGPRIKGDRLKLSDVINEKQFRPRYLNGTWISGSEFLYSDPSGGISIKDFKTRKSRVLMSNSTFRQLNSHSYTVSPDLEFVLINSNQKRIYRHSKTAKYALYSVRESSYVWISLEENEEPTEDIQLAAWSPKGHSLAFVYKNNIYYQRDTSVNKKTFRKLTTSGIQGLIFNGVPDWLYEEEILSQNSALWFSTDGSRLLYATFNDTLVGKISLNQYSPEAEFMPTKVTDIPSYPQTKYLRYPKVGTLNPTFELNIINLEDESRKSEFKVTPPESIQRSGDYYFTSVKWISRSEVCIVWLNRAQNFSVVSRCTLPTYNCREIHSQRAEANGWVEISPPPVFSKDGSKMIFIEPVRDSSAGSFPQLLQTDANPRLRPPGAKSLTHGKFTVTEIIGWDEKNHFVYYIGTQPNSPGVRHLFRVGDLEIQGVKSESAILCLSCGASHEPKDLTYNQSTLDNVNLTCEYATAKMSPDASFYVLVCKGPFIPHTQMFSLPDNKPLEVLDTNDDLKDILRKRSLPWAKTMTVPLPDTSVPARVRLILPPGLREHEEFIFPVVVNVYGGPGTQDVSSRWSMDWDHYLASNRDFIVIHMDVRGSGFSGNNFKHAVFHQLGTLEVKDSLYVLDYLLNNLSYVDKSKVAVWGWSYGGFLAAKMLAEDDNDIIKCAASVAPVTKWELYDSAYTERYMGAPDDKLPSLTGQENFEGYKNSDLTKQVLKFVGKNLLLVHGTSDNNVHFQQMAILTKSLVEQSILFRQQIYPDEDHGIHNSRDHLYRTIEEYFEDFIDFDKGSTDWEQIQDLFQMVE